MTIVITDQEGLNVVTASTRILWLFYCIGTLVFVFGYALNFISADLVTFEESPRIESVEELLHIDRVYPEAKVYAFNNLFMYNHLKNAPHGSTEHELFRFFDGNKTVNGISYGRWANVDGMGTQFIDQFSELQSVVRARKGGGLVLEENLSKLLRYPVCRMDPLFYKYRTVSRGVIAPGILSTFINKRSNRMLQKYVNYAFSTQFEMATMNKACATAVEFVDVPSSASQLEVNKCLFRYQERPEVEFNPVKFNLLRKTLNVIMWCLVVAEIVLLTELLLWKCALWLTVS